MIKRIFIDWTKPCLKAVTKLLCDQYAAETTIDLSLLIITTPGSRAGRRLLELMVFEAEDRGLSLLPPKFTTPGALPELLYESSSPIANNIERRLAWTEAFKQLSDKEKSVLSSKLLESESLDNGLILSRQIDALYRELAAERKSFEDVAKACQEIPDCHDENRWFVLEECLKKFRKALSERGLVDSYTAREVALEKKEISIDKEVVLIASADLNATVKSFVDLIKDKVSILIHAPENLSDEFDEYGCIDIPSWKEKIVSVPKEKISVEVKLDNQAQQAIEFIAEKAQAKTFEDVSCGLMDTNVSPFLIEKLGEFGIPVRDASGLLVSDTPPLDFIKKASEFNSSSSFVDFAALVRHQDVYTYLKNSADTPDNILEILDKYHLSFLQAELAEEVFGEGEICIELKQIFEPIKQLLEPVECNKLKASSWVEKVRLIVMSLYADQAPDQRSTDAIITLSKSLAMFEELLADFDQEIMFSQFVSLLFGDLESASLPPEGETEAVELLGWLELQLDDASYLVCTGMNEGYAPQSIVGDPFLPDLIRSKLGLLDNDRRFARDKYVLSTLLNSKKHLHFIAGRLDGRGEPLTISRLLLSCKPSELAERVSSFYSDTAIIITENIDEAPSSFLPNKPSKLSKDPETISVTGFRTYLACPYRYYLRHVLRLDSLSDRDLELDGRSFGNIAHDILKTFGNSAVKASDDPKIISEYLDASLEKYWFTHFGALAHAAVYIQKEQLRERFRIFAEHQANRVKEGWEIKHVEKRLSNVFIETSSGNVELRGQIDRIDWNEKQGRWAIFDYKTGDDGSDPQSSHYASRKAEWKDFQLPAYQFAFLKMFPEANDCELGYINLSADSDKAGFVLWQKYNQDLQTSAEEEMKKIATLVKSQEFWPPAEKSIQFDNYAALCGTGKFVQEDNV